MGTLTDQMRVETTAEQDYMLQQWVEKKQPHCIELDSNGQGTRTYLMRMPDWATMASILSLDLEFAADLEDLHMDVSEWEQAGKPPVWSGNLPRGANRYSPPPSWSGYPNPSVPS